MANKPQDDISFVQSGNWNIADAYSKLKTMKLIYEFDQYRTLAIFGSADILEDFVITQEVKNEARIKALRRIKEILEMIIDNSLFAIKKKSDKVIMENCHDLLIEIEKLFPFVEKVILIENYNGMRRVININEEIFHKIYKILIHVYKEILTPMNNSDLIYTSYEEYTVDEIKDSFKKRLIEQG